jgi:hypothetical protein
VVDIKQYVEIATFNVLVDPFSSEPLLILYCNIFFYALSFVQERLRVERRIGVNFTAGASTSTFKHRFEQTPQNTTHGPSIQQQSGESQ